MPGPRGPFLAFPDLLGSRQLAGIPLHYLVDDCLCGRLLVWLPPFRRGFPGHHVRDIALAPAGHAHVKGLPGQRVRDQHVRVVDGPALRHMDIARVVQFGVRGEVGAGHQEPGRPAPARQPADHLRVLALPALDPQHVPVGQPLPAGVDLRVEPGPDQVSGAGPVPVRQRCTGLHHGPHLDELGLHPPCKLGGFLVRPGEQDRVPPVQVIGQPCTRGTVERRLPVAAPDPAAPVIGRDNGEITFP